MSSQLQDEITEGAEKLFAAYRDRLAGTENWNELKPHEKDAWESVAVAAIERYSPWSVDAHV